MRAAALVALGLLALAAAPAAAPPARAQALADLADPGDPAARRRGAQALGETGLMADLPALVRALRDADSLVRALAEQAMWRLWSRSGDVETDRLFAIGVEQMGQRALEAAVESFTRVIERTPDFAEGWNKRATVYFLLGEWEKSGADCDEVLARNPWHYGALSGYGMIALRLDQPERALDFFEKALAVNPNLHQVQETIETLKGALLQRRRDLI